MNFKNNFIKTFFDRQTPKTRRLIYFGLSILLKQILNINIKFLLIIIENYKLFYFKLL